MDQVKPLTFQIEEIQARFELFVSNVFLNDENNVVRTEILPKLWEVSVPEKDFKVLVECKNIGNWHGVEQWCAVVTEPNGDSSNFLLFEEEIKVWLEEQRRMRGIES
ncbi:hypothetical protein BpOF4_20119 (plasmid) [Alkalihalophilus pseudofirmus OF4]|uniref:Uncharacterized protein n=1 Tax=Alkalihalophilus pseudofirmus (strain ATCC BAA-2126 / JCM 17055 / OF4) TaxID=398511 RepID=D3G0Z7_ALKPO|nr:hypothetical protein [Alkalihalophilus pseudofirmus]ADC52023.1 hypothetical protein BpOF4_20119 [Alkalihalophilus pseudofirmus OF4]